MDQSHHEEQAHLDVVVLHPRDAAAAAEGGADRLLLSAHPERGHLPPEPATLSAVVRETDLPVWPVLAQPTASTRSLADLVRQGTAYVELGARGLAFGLLDDDLEVDTDRCVDLVAELGEPWVFHGFDAALDTDRAWREVRGLPGLEAVVTSGSTRGLAHGGEDLLARVRNDPRAAELTLVGGGLTPEWVPWLVRAGVRRFAVGTSARADSSWTRGNVSAQQVRTWRMLIDDALSRTLGLEPD